MNYNSEYESAIKLAKQPEKDEHFNNPEGHQILDKGGPLIYADFLEERNKPTLAKLVRESIPTHYSEYPLQRHIATLSNDEEYRGLGQRLRDEISEGRQAEVKRLKNNTPRVFILGKHKDGISRRIGIHIPNSTNDKLHYMFADIPEKESKKYIKQLQKENVHVD